MAIDEVWREQTKVPSKPVDHVVVASALAGPELKLSEGAHGDHWVRKGRPFELRMLCEAREGSRKKETYRFALTTRVGDQANEPVTLEIEDKRGSKEQEHAYLRQTHKIDEPGRYEVVAHVRVAYKEANWRSEETLGRDERALEVRFPLIVQ